MVKKKTKVLSMVLACVLLLSISIIGANAAVVTMRYVGDVNNDGEITIRDATLLNGFLNGKAELSMLSQLAADVDGDGYLTTSDVYQIQQYLADIIYGFDAGVFVVIPTRLLGDVNGDNQITDADVQMVQRYLADLTTFTLVQKLAADTNGDGNITINDATTISLYLAGHSTEFSGTEYIGVPD